MILGTFSVGFSFDDAFAKVEKVTICHKPDTVDEETKQIPINALKGHLGHGDTEGECAPPEPDKTFCEIIVDEVGVGNFNVVQVITLFYSVYETSGDGELAQSELPITVDEFNDADTDGNGKINANPEFVNYYFTNCLF